ncbi:hypothetical protein [Amycolatopsis sp. H20-H5]|uniref:hypothetical protein n=1 Tax=Amycolatopsis sp. H20-H5 TaxID=3046309 RepID=UPI002DB6F160|nr:hypothetical protein [Amycolatopsis sp. H20-H5]MEC3981851.1 hypothetical protein [Amycolatopsis sp. H20-H5]
MSTNPYAQPYAAQPGAPALQRPGRALPRVLSALGGLALTPLGLWLLIYGGGRLQQSLQLTRGTDVLGIALTIAGGLVLLGVAVLGAVSSLGPILGGLVWGVLPGLLGVLAPLDIYHWVYNVADSRTFTSSLLTLLALGAILGIGMLLVGCGLAAAITRRRR